MSDEKALIVSDDIVVTFIIVGGIFFSLLLIGVFLWIFLRELRKSQDDE